MSYLKRIWSFIKNLLGLSPKRKYLGRKVPKSPPTDSFDGTDRYVAIYSGASEGNHFFVRGKKLSTYEAARRYAIVSMDLDDDGIAYILPDQKDALIENLGIEHYKTALKAIINS